MSDNSDVSIDEMLDNMADPEERQARKLSCPIDGCDYSAMEAESVSGHVSASSQDDHIWANTRYEGWKHYNREHGDWDDTTSSNSSESSASFNQSNDSESNAVNSSEAAENESVIDVSAEDVAEVEVPCPIEGCTVEDTAPSVASHLEDVSDGSHKWSETRFDGRREFFKYIDNLLG